MAKKGLYFFVGIIIGLGVTGLILLNPFSGQNIELEKSFFHLDRPQVIGFLPYWLLGKAAADYTKYLNTLAYFSLTIDTDGKIARLTNPQESDPGWLTLKGDKVKPFLETAQKHNQNLSLLIFSGDNDKIGQLINTPEQSAQNLIADVTPIMKQFGFKDLNLDIEYTTEASEEARVNMTKFVKEVRSGVDKNKLGTLTIDISPTAFIKKYLVNPKEVAPLVDYLVVMAYDYHYIGSYVTGPVAPLRGATESAEFDTDSSIKQALTFIPPKKIILGVPLYGYEWESLGDTPRSAIIPSTGLIASHQRVAALLENCSTCSAKLDPQAEESYIIYKDLQTNTYHQIFAPDKNLISSRIEYAKKLGLGGIALWALGYEGQNILEPLKDYR